MSALPEHAEGHLVVEPHDLVLKRARGDQAPLTWLPHDRPGLLDAAGLDLWETAITSVVGPPRRSS